LYEGFTKRHAWHSTGLTDLTCLCLLNKDALSVILWVKQSVWWHRSTKISDVVAAKCSCGAKTAGHIDRVQRWHYSLTRYCNLRLSPIEKAPPLCSTWPDRTKCLIIPAVISYSHCKQTEIRLTQPKHCPIRRAGEAHALLSTSCCAPVPTTVFSIDCSCTHLVRRAAVQHGLAQLRQH
jgi:hypothetical protein